MACTLYFNDRGYDVLTTSWTAASKNGRSVDVCYTWGADRASFINSATGTARVELAIPFRNFLKYVQECEKSGQIADLTDDNLRALANDKPKFPIHSL